jgi:hypothetical protein
LTAAAIETENNAEGASGQRVTADPSGNDPQFPKNNLAVVDRLQRNNPAQYRDLIAGFSGDEESAELKAALFIGNSQARIDAMGGRPAVITLLNLAEDAIYMADHPGYTARTTDLHRTPSAFGSDGESAGMAYYPPPESGWTRPTANQILFLVTANQATGGQINADTMMEFVKVIGGSSAITDQKLHAPSVAAGFLAVKQVVETTGRAAYMNTPFKDVAFYAKNPQLLDSNPPANANDIKLALLYVSYQAKANAGYSEEGVQFTQRMEDQGYVLREGRIFTKDTWIGIQNAGIDTANSTVRALAVIGAAVSMGEGNLSADPIRDVNSVLSTPPLLSHVGGPCNTPSECAQRRNGAVAELGIELFAPGTILKTVDFAKDGLILGVRGVTNALSTTANAGEVLRIETTAARAAAATRAPTVANGANDARVVTNTTNTGNSGVRAAGAADEATDVVEIVVTAQRVERPLPQVIATPIERPVVEVPKVDSPKPVVEPPVVEPVPPHQFDNIDDILPNPNTKVISPSEANALEPPNKGVIYVQESPVGSQAAQDFQAGCAGAFCDTLSGKNAAPALRYDNTVTHGNDYVKFDGIEKAADGKSVILIDRKLKLADFNPGAQAATESTLLRVSEAIRQNPGYQVVYEFPTQVAKLRADQFIAQLVAKNPQLAGAVKTRVAVPR